MSKNDERLKLSLFHDKNSLNEKGSPSEKSKKDINPFLFLVVFPVAMTGLVVTMREDLRQQLAAVGRRWRASTKE